MRDDASTPSWVWVFHGDGPRRVASAVFSELALAEAWIRRTGASGLLTRYPVDLSVYDWAVAEGHWTPTRDEHRTPDYMQNFNSAYLEHIHYERGARASGG